MQYYGNGANDPWGIIGDANYGVYGDGKSGSSSKIGVYGIVGTGSAESYDFIGVKGVSNNPNDVLGHGGWFQGEWRGIYATNPNSNGGYAGYFNNHLYVVGNSTASGLKSFLIDHPSDPENKILRHYCVESNQGMVMYRGVARLNDNGVARVPAENYFKDLVDEQNATVIVSAVGKPFPTGYEWNNSRDTVIIYGEPGREVSYLIMAERDDPAYRFYKKPVVELKNGDEKGFMRGYYINHEAYGQPWEKSYDYLWHHKGREFKQPQPAYPARMDEEKMRIEKQKEDTFRKSLR